ncbi:MAG: hypothetical protein CMB80_01805 [Flammeovirgaceae bacterium]|nr:hypothetical protein [Flammeovirgaceae bacterium]
MTTVEEKPLSLEKRKLRAEVLYKKIQALYRIVNTQNNIGRNVPCPCRSGRKWKKCCLVIHEKNTLRLEQMIKEYKRMCVEFNRRKKSKI